MFVNNNTESLYLSGINYLKDVELLSHLDDNSKIMTKIEYGLIDPGFVITTISKLAVDFFSLCPVAAYASYYIHNNVHKICENFYGHIVDSFVSHKDFNALTDFQKYQLHMYAIQQDQKYNNDVQKCINDQWFQIAYENKGMFLTMAIVMIISGRLLYNQWCKKSPQRKILSLSLINNYRNMKKAMIRAFNEASDNKDDEKATNIKSMASRLNAKLDELKTRFKKETALSDEEISKCIKFLQKGVNKVLNQSNNN